MIHPKMRSGTQASCLVAATVPPLLGALDSRSVFNTLQHAPHKSHKVMKTADMLEEEDKAAAPFR